LNLTAKADIIEAVSDESIEKEDEGTEEVVANK